MVDNNTNEIDSFCGLLPLPGSVEK